MDNKHSSEGIFIQTKRSKIRQRIWFTSTMFFAHTGNKIIFFIQEVVEEEMERLNVENTAMSLAVGI